MKATSEIEQLSARENESERSKCLDKRAANGDEGETEMRPQQWKLLANIGGAIGGIVIAGAALFGLFFETFPAEQTAILILYLLLGAALTMIYSSKTAVRYKIAKR